MFRLNSLYSILRKHFVQHADAEINVPQVALLLCEIQLISIIILSTFMSFWSWLKEIFRKVKIARSQHSIVHIGRQSYICWLACESKTWNRTLSALISILMTNKRIRVSIEYWKLKLK